MPGPFSFLPVNNKPGLKARVQAKVGSHDNKDKVLPESRPGPGAEVEMDDKDDDEWYDTTSGTSEESTTPIKKSKRLNKADVNNGLISVKSISPEEEERLLPYMPALFGLDLPPCGPEPQVAYEIINARLREHWLSHRGQRSTVEISQTIQETLRNQSYLWPAFMLKGPVKKRKPWRREPVFKYELYWIDYFVREAQQQDPELMTESELLDRRMQSSVPPELRLHVERSDVLRLWDDWNKKKRAKTPMLPESDEQSHLGEESVLLDKQSEQGEKTVHDAGGTVSNEPTSAHATNNRPSNNDGAPDDAYLWSQGGHD